LLNHQLSLGLQKAGERVAVHEIKCGSASILALSVTGQVAHLFISFLPWHL
jgi:hypothetical protein